MAFNALDDCGLSGSVIRLKQLTSNKALTLMVTLLSIIAMYILIAFEGNEEEAAAVILFMRDTIDALAEEATVLSMVD